MRCLSDVDVIFFQPAVGRQYGVISLGFLTLSSFLRKNGYSSRIVALSGKDTVGTVTKKINQFKPKVVCVSLHWYIHSYESLKIAEAVKKADSSMKVVVGGHTSTHFDQQILKFSPNIDLLIKGDGEKPLLDYISTLEPEKVENASYRIGDAIISKPVTYRQLSLENLTASQENMGEMIDEWDEYLKATRIRTSAPIPSGKIVEEVFTNPNEFYLFLGKGCNYNCCFCGTSKTGLTRIFHRGYALFRPVEDVVKDAENLKKNGVENLFVDFGPFQDELFFKKLFGELAKLELDITFLPWNLPSNELISQVGESFRNFEIQISPDTGSESLRSSLFDKGFHRQFYSNAELVNRIEKISEVGSSRGAQFFLWFICGLPFETDADYLETVKLAVEMKKRFPHLFRKPQDQLNCIPLRLTPGAPVDLWPEKFGMRKFRSTFEEYYEYCRQMEFGGIKHPLGLERLDLSEAAIVKRSEEFKDIINNA